MSHRWGRNVCVSVRVPVYFLLWAFELAVLCFLLISQRQTGCCREGNILQRSLTIKRVSSSLCCKALWVFVMPTEACFNLFKVPVSMCASAKVSVFKSFYRFFFSAETYNDFDSRVIEVSVCPLTRRTTNINRSFICQHFKCVMFKLRSFILAMRTALQVLLACHIQLGTKDIQKAEIL